MNFDKGIPTIPKSRVVAWSSSFKHPKSTHNRVINEHYFNSAVEIFLPFHNEKKITKFKEEISKLEKSHHFYTSNSTKLSELVEMSHDYFSKGMVVYATSISIHSDGSNGFCILPTGEIILSLDKDTYESFGINGKKSKFSEQHIIQVQFSKLTKEKPLYKKLISSLEKTLPVSCLISVYNSDECVELKNFKKIQGFGGSKEYRYDSFDIPNLSKNSINDEGMMLLDFLGACSISSDCKTPHGFKSYETKKTVHLQKFYGFIPPHVITKILNLILKLEMESEWACISVNGFVDNIVSWRNFEHGHGISGENDYKYIIFKNEDYWLLQVLGQDDIYS